ncbi:universal stress protein [Halobacteriales archaeon SW_7_65_23]|nr:MAG: universal stress protein [Halobacteriales archaeon SW_7_65_23]
MYDSILIPTDGSEEAAQAVTHGLELAEAFDAKVHALYVVENKATYILTAELDDEEMEEYKDYGRGVVKTVADEAADIGLDSTGVIRVGRIAEEIAEYAEDNEIDKIVMGRRGRGAIEQYLGSTSEKVIRMTDIPVTVVGTEL